VRYGEGKLERMKSLGKWEREKTRRKWRCRGRASIFLFKSYVPYTVN